jgi:ATP-binding cassette subfamily C protein CydC
LSTTDFLRLTVSLLRPRLSRLLAATALGVLSLGSALALTAVSAWLITRAWQMPPVLDLTVAVVAVRALGISRGVLGYCQRLAAHDTALRAAGHARTELYRRLADAPAEVVMRLPSGDLLARAGASVDELSDVLVRAALPIAVAAVLSVPAVGLIAAVSPGAAVVLAACLLIAGVVAPVLAGRAVMAAEGVAAEHHSRRDTAALLALEHAAELRVGGRLADVLAEAREAQHDWGAVADRAAAPAALAAAVPSLAIGASALGAVVAGIGLAGSVAPTSLAVLMLVPLAAFEATAALPGAAVALNRARIAARRLGDVVAAGTAGRRRPDVPTLDVGPGARIAVTGPSGSGKTTLLLAIAAEYSDRVGGAGLFAEDAHLFSTTVRDNLLVARGDATDEELRSALVRVGLGDWLDALPDGLATVLVGGSAAVSAGQRRRLLLARARIAPFRVILLDEPTEHLDAADGARLLTELLTPGEFFPADRAVVVATHHLPRDTGCERLELTPGQVTSET